MPRLILNLSPGAQTASVATLASQLAGVQDATAARQSPIVIVTVPEITADVKQRLADLNGVTSVDEDIQAVPQVAEERATEDFLRRVRALRGEEEVPPLVELESEVATDGGATLPVAGDAPAPLGLTTGAEVASATDSLAFTGATEAHDRGQRGQNAIAVIVDTGVPESQIAPDRRLEGADLTGEDDPWSPYAAHGGMTAGIMAGGPETAGIDVGFAPAADVFPIKTTLAASELILAQDIIADLANEHDRPIVVNNSWGFTECSGLCAHSVTNAIDNVASQPGIYQVFAAGNQAQTCGQACDGSTVGIAGPNSLPSGIAVAATGHDGDPTALHPYSSRGGPSPSCGSQKPDVAAPIFGEVPWGASSRNIGNGGGTSGACPQVAGTVALFASAGGSIGGVAGAIEQTASQFQGSGWNGCTGHGNLQASAAATEEPVVQAGFGTAGKIAAGAVAVGFLGAVLREAAS